MCTGSQFLPNRVLTACYSLGTFHCTDMLLWICCPGSCHWILWWTLLQTWLNNVLVDGLSLVLIIRFSLVGVDVALVDCLANRCVKPCNSVAKLSLSWTFFTRVEFILMFGYGCFVRWFWLTCLWAEIQMVREHSDFPGNARGVKKFGGKTPVLLPQPEETPRLLWCRTDRHQVFYVAEVDGNLLAFWALLLLYKPVMNIWRGKIYLFPITLSVINNKLPKLFNWFANTTLI